jgi:hypothetical protein
MNPRLVESRKARAAAPETGSRSFIEPPIVGIGVSVTGDSFAPYDFEAAAKGRRSTRR